LSALRGNPRPDPDDVKFDHDDRELLKFIYDGVDPKTIAGELDITPGTVYVRRKELCRRAGVPDVLTLHIWLTQQQGVFFPGVVFRRGLHKQPCPCGSGFCRGRIESHLPPHACQA